MTTHPRLAAAAVAALALALSPSIAAQAHPGHTHLHGHGHTTTHTAPGHGPDARAARALAHLDRRLVGAVRDARMARLTDADTAALRTNVATDEATIDAASAALAADGSDVDLAAARAIIRSFRPHVYVVATNIVRHSERVLAEVGDLQPLVTPGSTDETDLSTAAGLLATVQAGGFTATTDGATLRAAQHAVVSAQALVAQVRDDVAGG
jgi:hypothetical protein